MRPSLARAIGVVILVASLDGYAADRFLMGVSISNWSSGEWLVFGIIAVTLLLTGTLVWLAIEAQFLAPRRLKYKRTAELADPVDIHFLASPTSQNRRMAYIVQDDKEHLFNEIVLRPNRITLVEFRMHPRTIFTSDYMVFGSLDHEGDNDHVYQNRPRPLSLVDTYRQGYIDNNAIPNVTPGYVINDREQYRWVYNIRWDGHNTRIIGIHIQTYGIGRYLWTTIFAGEEIGDKRLNLLIRVEQPSDVKLRCANGDCKVPHTVAARFAEDTKDRQFLPPPSPTPRSRRSKTSQGKSRV
jgi:hypothetical protein